MKKSQLTNTKSLSMMKNKANETQQRIDALFSFKDPEEEIDSMAHALMAQFLSEAQIAADRKGINRKTLAKEVGTSASYLTQLFRGHKLLNLTMAAKLQKALDFEYVIRSNQNDFDADKYNDGLVSKLVLITSKRRNSFSSVLQFEEFNHQDSNDEQCPSLQNYDQVQAS